MIHMIMDIGVTDSLDVAGVRILSGMYRAK